MIHTFAGKGIFGSPTTQTGPTGAYRAQEEQLPGVDGVRLYRLGREPVIWKVRGRLSGLSLESVREAVSLGQSYQDGQLYTFTDSAGKPYQYCQLVSLTPTGPYEGIRFPNNDFGVTVEIEATVRWVAPVSIDEGLG